VNLDDVVARFGAGGADGGVAAGEVVAGVDADASRVACFAGEDVCRLARFEERGGVQHRSRPVIPGDDRVEIGEVAVDELRDDDDGIQVENNLVAPLWHVNEYLFHVIAHHTRQLFQGASGHDDGARALYVAGELGRAAREAEAVGGGHSQRIAFKMGVDAGERGARIVCGGGE